LIIAARIVTQFLSVLAPPGKLIAQAAHRLYREKALVCLHATRNGSRTPLGDTGFNRR
jgi:hypothetical protein